MAPNSLLRLGTVGLLGLTLFGAAVKLHEPDVPEPTRAIPAVVPADPLAAELTRCRNLGLEAADDPTCKDVWAKTRARFFSPPKAPMEH